MNPLPSISVIVPSKDRLPGVQRLIANIHNQDYPQGRVEIIVIDDGSEARYDLDAPGVRLIRHARSAGAQQSRNEGLATATGDLAFMCDDDIELLGRDFFRLAAALLLERPTVAAVFARKTDVHTEDGHPHQREFSVSRPTFYSGDLVRCRAAGGPVAWGNQAYFVRRRLLLDLGGYDGIYGLNGGHSFREESDVHARLRAAGHQLWYLPEIAFRHHVTSSGGHGPAVGRRLFWIAHNHLVFLRRHLGCWPLRAGGFLFDVLRYSWVQGRFRYLPSMLRGYAAGWRDALRDRGPGRNPWLRQT